MDARILEFVTAVRANARPPHRAVYEDLAVRLDGFLRRRHRTLGAVHAADLVQFAAGQAQAPWSSRADRRQSQAALCVLVRWLDRRRLDRLRIAGTVRQSVRAAERTVRASALLAAALPPANRRRRFGVSDSRAGLWRVAARGDAHLVVRNVRGGAPIGPIALPAAVVRAVPADAVLALELRGPEPRWRVASYGGCYAPGEALPRLARRRSSRA